jgi:anti-sigma regulatory factor (Ser/Thr protein kinase)
MATLTEDVELVVSELVTNAVKASAKETDDVAVWLWADGQSNLLIEVHDFGAGIPLLVDPADDETSGRGLLLVAALSKDWGCCPSGAGKVVWAHLCPDTVN